MKPYTITYREYYRLKNTTNALKSLGRSARRFFIGLFAEDFDFNALPVLRRARCFSFSPFAFGEGEKNRLKVAPVIEAR